MPIAPPDLTVSFPNGSYSACLLQRRIFMLWIATQGLASRDDIDGTIGTAYQGLHYSRGTIDVPLEAGWCAYVSFWCAFPESIEWLRSVPLPKGARFTEPDVVHP